MTHPLDRVTFSMVLSDFNLISINIKLDNVLYRGKKEIILKYANKMDFLQSRLISETVYCPFGHTHYTVNENAMDSY